MVVTIVLFLMTMQEQLHAYVECYHLMQGYAFAKTLASLASGLALALASKFPIVPKGVLWEWFSANGA